MRWPCLLLILALAGCSSPRQSEVLGPEARLLVQTKVGNAVVMLGALPTGEWVTAVHHGKDDLGSQTMPPQDQPMPFLSGNVAVVAAKAPDGASSCELVTDERKVVKGKVANGACLIAWFTESGKPAFILRMLDSKGDEIYRYPPPGGLPAA
jgi:hypothetical protein